MGALSNTLTKVLDTLATVVKDDFIVAICIVYKLPLWTYNKKNFKYINELELVK